MTMKHLPNTDNISFSHKDASWEQ